MELNKAAFNKHLLNGNPVVKINMKTIIFKYVFS